MLMLVGVVFILPLQDKAAAGTLPANQITVIYGAHGSAVGVVEPSRPYFKPVICVATIRPVQTSGDTRINASKPRK
jgi:hypothetical protein